MIGPHIDTILYVTGGATASMLAQFVAPHRILKAFNQVDVTEPIALFFARAAGLAIGSIGVLLLWAAFDSAIRGPVVAVAAAGKFVFVATILARFEDVGRGFLLTAVFDSICVVLYVGFLLGL